MYMEIKITRLFTLTHISVILFSPHSARMIISTADLPPGGGGGGGTRLIWWTGCAAEMGDFFPKNP